MARASLATAVMLLCVVFSTEARADACGCCGCGEPLALVPEADPAQAESQRALEGLLAAGTAVTVASYVLGVLIARGEPHPNFVIDTIPVAGPIASAVRNGTDSGNASLLSFLGAAQGMGLLVIASALTDLAARKHVLVDLSAGPNGCGASVTFKLP
jgi:hypothetical protein